jgi:integrase
MRKTPPLLEFDRALKAYLSSRRALGRALRTDEYVLKRLRACLVRARYSDLNAASFAGWRQGLRHCAENTQLDWAMMVMRFCRYRRRRESRCFLPPRWTLGRRRPYALPTPIKGKEVRQLLDFANEPWPRSDSPLSRAAQRLAVVLMATAGLRRSEAARLNLEDVDAETGVLRIQASKFHKSRWVPLSPSATRELRTYLSVRAKLVARRLPPQTLLLNYRGQGFTSEGLSEVVHDLMARSGIWARATRIPRVHDFRHGFAVAVLQGWYEAGHDVQSELPKLAMYMGHVSIASSAYYLRFMPAVVELASERFASSCGDLIAGGAP